jgi:hypothetical protein
MVVQQPNSISHAAMGEKERKKKSERMGERERERKKSERIRV